MAEAGVSSSKRAKAVEPFGKGWHEALDHGQCLLQITVVGTPMLLRIYRGIKLLFNMAQLSSLDPRGESLSPLSCGVVEAQPSQSPERT